MDLTTPLDVLTNAVHQTSLCSPETALREATDLLATLDVFGWHLAPDVSLPTEAPTRRGGMRTSDAAAESIDDVSERQWATWNALRNFGPMTDEDLERLPQFRAYGHSTIRKRRSELFEQKAVVPCGARKNSRGRQMILWGDAK